MTTDSITLSAEADEIVRAHAQDTGLTVEAALDELIHRGAQELNLRDLRDAIESIRATVDDTYQALDVVTPYAIAALGLMAHWATRSSPTRLDEVDYAHAALDTGRAAWDGHIGARGLKLPTRPAAEQPLEHTAQ